MKLEEMLNALRLCRMSADEEDSPCDKCPYREHNDNLYSCIDKRSEDLEKVLLWAIDVKQTLRVFTGE